jgi:hypothetical protein
MVDADEGQNSLLLQTLVSSEQGVYIIISEGNVIQSGGARRPLSQIWRRSDRNPVMFVIIRKKDKTAAGVKNDLRTKDDAIPLHHRVDVRPGAQHDMSEFTG